MAHLALHFLGTFQATLDNHPIAGIESDKVRALLIYLAMESAESHSRDELIGLLWPDRPEATARANLRQAIANLRQVLGDRVADPPFLIVAGDTLQFNQASDSWLDVTAFGQVLQACADHHHRQVRACRWCVRQQQAAIELYRGDFLAQLRHSSEAFEEWALLKREKLHHAALDVMYRLAEYHDRCGNYALVQRYALKQLELDLWREEAHRQMMKALALSGQRSAALAQYEKCRRILAAELGVEPASATQQLYDQIKLGYLKIVPNSPPLPAPCTLFVGRERELAEIDRLMTESTCRVVTLVGPGGVGKTQLALHAVAAQVDAFADGVRYISLASLDSAELLLATIGYVLGLRLEAGDDSIMQLVDYLAHREMLIVLDNFEQLSSAGAERLAALVACVPFTVVFLVTSRERLNLRDEWVINVPGLSVPSDERSGDVAHYSAVQMFVQHVQRVCGAITLSTEDWQHVARICRMTAGLPLAIELAAALARHRSFADIEREIAHSLDFVTAPLNDLPKRHRSLRAVFDQSWYLLSPIERDVIQALAVFRGPFTTAAAEQIAGATAQNLADLVDKSLLRSIDDDRFVLHEVIQPYAQEQLHSSGAVEQVCERHSAYYFEQAVTAGICLIGHDQARGLSQLDADLDNLRAALHWSLEACPEVALEVCGGLWHYWLMRGYLSEGRRWLEQACGATAGGDHPRARARALTGVANLAWAQGDYAEAYKQAEQSVLLWQTLNDEQGLARAVTILGIAAGYSGDHIGAVAALKESVAACRACNDQWGLATALFYLADGDAVPQTHVAAQALLAESLSIFEMLGDRRGAALAMHGLGVWAYRSGDLSAAHIWLRRALIERQTIDDRWLTAQTLNILGKVAQHEDQLTEAEQLYDESLNTYRELGARRHEAQLIHNLGHVALSRNDLERANQLFTETLGIFCQLEDVCGIAAALDGLGVSHVLSGTYVNGVLLFGLADRLRAHCDILMPPTDQRDYMRYVMTARPNIDTTQFSETWAAGYAMSIELDASPMQ